jgi:Ca2+-transporting ATPase
MRLGRESGIITAAGIASYLYGISRYGIGPQARTIAFLGLTSAQLLHTFSARSLRHTMFHSGRMPPNNYVPLAVGGGIALEVLAAVLPPLRSVLGLAPIGLVDALVCAASAVTSLLANETIKLMTTGRPQLESGPAAVTVLQPQPAAA